MRVSNSIIPKTTLPARLVRWISTRRICGDRLKTSRRHMRSRKQNRQDIVKRSTILIDDLINDSIPYCACVIVRISGDFYDDRHENRLVEIRLYCDPNSHQLLKDCLGILGIDMMLLFYLDMMLL